MLGVVASGQNIECGGHGSRRAASDSSFTDEKDDETVVLPLVLFEDCADLPPGSQPVRTTEGERGVRRGG